MHSVNYLTCCIVLQNHVRIRLHDISCHERLSLFLGAGGDFHARSDLAIVQTAIVSEFRAVSNDSVLQRTLLADCNTIHDDDVVEAALVSQRARFSDRRRLHVDFRTEVASLQCQGLELAVSFRTLWNSNVGVTLGSAVGDGLLAGKQVCGYRVGAKGCLRREDNRQDGIGLLVHRSNGESGCFCGFVRVVAVLAVLVGAGPCRSTAVVGSNVFGAG
mmetsp:Transcript_4943/g.12083  ORF Transcript_4943/g.12083 Transcript_4943/m.12083 type:complete len:217 (+) Transcript_4943:183-833(+)